MQRHWSRIACKYALWRITMIDLKGLTLKYPSWKGVFDLHFSVGKGEVMGYLGPNGAGKTTTIRALLGFMKPNNGHAPLMESIASPMRPGYKKTSDTFRVKSPFWMA